MRLPIKTKKPILDESELKKVAESVVLNYFQFWGQSAKERVEAIGRAANLAGVEVKFTEIGGEVIPSCPEDSLWPQFCNEIAKCWPLGQFEWERDAVIAVIRRFNAEVIKAS